ncbi:unnamed protein product [Dibothriocephalus latus]|uniref:Integrase zinc-binding domain-containing protein n=1 Tax=Dibothriocephalus latus TaxID=60516 RepID=A0A3P7LXI9_DIBLA|nr:unnamed protein product [Dibothriocephalus latus]
MFADHVVIPPQLRPVVLQKLHAHSGTGRMKSTARSFAYWPCIDSEIDYIVQRSSRCQRAAKTFARQPFVPRQTPDRP